MDTGVRAHGAGCGAAGMIGTREHLESEIKTGDLSGTVQKSFKGTK